MRKRWLWIGGLCVLAVAWYGLRRSNRHGQLDLGSSNADVARAFAVAKAEARQWHRNACAGSLNLAITPDGRVIIEGEFFGKAPFQRFTDELNVQVDLTDGHILSKEEAKGSLEPNYDYARPLNVVLRSDWHRVRAVADSAYGNYFKAHHPDALTRLMVEFDKQWWVVYSSDSSGAYTHLRIWDSAAHRTLVGKVEMLDSVNTPHARARGVR